MKIQDLMNITIMQAFLVALLMPTRGLQIAIAIGGIMMIVAKKLYTKQEEEA